MVVIRVIFWAWLLISVAILLFRLGRRLFRRGPRLATSGVGSPTTTSADPAPSADPASGGEAISPDAEISPDPVVSRGEGILPDAADSRDPADPATPTPEPVAPRRPIVDPASSSGESTAPRRAPSRPASSARTIAEMVAGIRMPCDLAPVPGAEPRPGSLESVAFLTSGHTAEGVGQATASELERLGFRVHALANDQILATRGDDELKLAVHPRASSVAYGGRPAFPSATMAMVALELWRD